MALGALQRRVLGQVLSETLTLVGLRITCGLPAALVATRPLAGFLYGVNTTDPTVLLASAGFLDLTATVAGCVPALRAARIDPVVALRDE